MSSMVTLVAQNRRQRRAMARRTSWSYDAASQLTSESRPGYSASYTFDGNGNRATKTVNGSVEQYTYDNGDKLITAGPKTYQYDLAGRTTRVTTNGQQTNLTYDDEDRLLTVVGPGISQAYTYNGLDTRVSKTHNGSLTSYHRNGSGVTAPLISDTGAVYTPGVSEKRSGVSTFLHGGMKDLGAQSDGSQNITATRQYDAYGMIVGSTGTWKGPFGYSGKAGYQEDETGLQLLGHRYYDSSTGRFLTRDIIKDGRNWYAYCDSNPVNCIDADGLKKKMIVMLGDTSDLPMAATLADLIDRYGDEYDIIIKRVSSNQQVEDLLVAADAVVLIGHGAPFCLAKNGGSLKNETLRRAAARRKRAGKGLLDVMLVLSCTALAEADDRAAYLALTMWLFGYVDNCPFFRTLGNTGAGAPYSRGRAGAWYGHPYAIGGGGGNIKGGGYTNVRLP